MIGGESLLTVCRITTVHRCDQDPYVSEDVMWPITDFDNDVITWSAASWCVDNSSIGDVSSREHAISPRHHAYKTSANFNSEELLI